MWLLVLAALVIVAVLLIIVWLWGQNDTEIIRAHGNVFQHYHYRPVTEGARTPANSLTLTVEFFLPANPARREELLFCYRHNLACPELDRIVFLTHNEREEAQFRELFGTPSKAVLQRITNTRATFGDLFTQGNAHTDPDGVLLVANSDIVFDATISQLKYLRTDEAASLTRHELTRAQPLMGAITIDPKWSSDVWAVRGRAHPKLEALDFTPGLLACDCVLIQHLVNSGGYHVFNPCYDVKTYHVHASNIRSYKPTDYVRQLGYLVKPVRWTPI